MKVTATLVSLLPLLMLESVVSLPQVSLARSPPDVSPHTEANMLKQASRTLDASTTNLDFGQCPDLEIQFDPVNAIFKPANDMYDAQAVAWYVERLANLGIFQTIPR
jgi:hypothetical protein